MKYLYWSVNKLVLYVIVTCITHSSRDAETTTAGEGHVQGMRPRQRPTPHQKTAPNLSPSWNRTMIANSNNDGSFGCDWAQPYTAKTGELGGARRGARTMCGHDILLNCSDISTSQNERCNKRTSATRWWVKKSARLTKLLFRFITPRNNSCFISVACKYWQIVLNFYRKDNDWWKTAYLYYTALPQKAHATRGNKKPLPCHCNA